MLWVNGNQRHPIIKDVFQNLLYPRDQCRGTNQNQIFECFNLHISSLNEILKKHKYLPVLLPTTLIELLASYSNFDFLGINLTEVYSSFHILT